MERTTGQELAFRESDGIGISLVWSGDDRLTVMVTDTRDGTAFELTARRDNALDVFYHPFAYLGLPAAA